MKKSSVKIKQNRNKGITLIALVITIIVLLILAGVSIAMLTGDNGILNQAQRAKEKTKIATVEEQRKLAIAEAIMNLENTIYIDKSGKKVPIPAGFAPTRIEGENTVEDGLVIIDSEGNEFVWIPVTNEADYNTNKTFSDINVSNQTQYDTGYLPVGQITGDDEGKLTFEKEKELVISKGGFYISRYEAGDGSASTNRTENSGITGQLVSKKGAYVYNYITAEQVKEKAKTFKVQDSNKVKSALISGVQWDMVMAFISSKPRKDGNGEDDYIVTEISNPKSKRHTDSLTMSGQNNADKVCNIYDLEGNAWEYVAEKSTYGTTGHYVHRGGMYNDECPASFRHNSDEGLAVNWGSFRFVLYVM